MRKLFILLILLCYILISNLNLSAQNILSPNARTKILLSGNNRTPVKGDGFKIISYRFEQILENEPEIKNNNQRREKKYRLVITGEFPAGVYIFWNNGAGSYFSNGTEKELHQIFYASNPVFEENAEIAVSRQEMEAPRTFLPEPFLVPDELRLPQRTKDELRRNISLNYAACGTILISENPMECVVIKAYKYPFPAPVMNEGWYFQIGNQTFPASLDYCVIKTKDFEKLKDGSWIVIKRGKGFSGGFTAGILDKSSLGKSYY